MTPPPFAAGAARSVGRRPGPAGGRRRGGAAVLESVVLGLVVLGRVQHPATLAGQAAAEPPAPPPVTGQCLLEPPPMSSLWISGQPSPPLGIGSCLSPHYGEVIAVVPAGAPGDDVPPCADGTHVDPLGYLGYPPTPATDDGWYPTSNYNVVASGPDQRQLDAGQSWIACSLAAPPFGDGLPFTTILRDSYTAGTLPAQYSSCLDGPDPSIANVRACDQPHAAQFFGQLSLTGPSADAQAVTDSCAQFIADATRITNLTTTVDLKVHAVAYATDSKGATLTTLPLQPGINAYVTCTVAATNGRLLNDSLIAIGDKPLPWAP